MNRAEGVEQPSRVRRRTPARIAAVVGPLATCAIAVDRQGQRHRRHRGPGPRAVGGRGRRQR